MKINVSLEICSGRVRINIPQAGIDADEPCLVAYAPSTKAREYLAFGPNEESLLAKLADNGYSLDGIEIFPFGGQHFNPQLANLILAHYVRLAADKTRPGIKLLRLFDHWHYDIQIPGYEDLPVDVCAQFELLLARFFRADGTSMINGQRIGRLLWRHTALDTILALLYVILMPGLFGLGSWGILKATGILESGPIPLWAIVTSVVLIFIILFASVMANALLLGIIWALAKHKPFIESIWSNFLPKVVAWRVNQFMLNRS